VRHLLEVHDGTVQAESPGEGRGSTFTVKLFQLYIAKPINSDELIAAVANLAESEQV